MLTEKLIDTLKMECKYKLIGLTFILSLMQIYLHFSDKYSIISAIIRLLSGITQTELTNGDSASILKEDSYKQEKCK